METLVLIGLMAAIALLLIALAVILRGLELAFPRFRAFMDERFGPDDGAGW